MIKIRQNLLKPDGDGGLEERQSTLKQKKLQADELLVELGFCASTDEARRWIMAGKVIVNDRRVDKAGEKIPADADVRVKGMRRYVGKGGYKLAGALSHFNIDVNGLVALDAGASTGGFTDCLLQHGARRVYAVDAGHGVLAGSLRNDDRVVNLERTNISDPALADLNPTPEFATVDLSYLSLRKAIPIVANLLTPTGRLLCLVKPLFEVRDADARRLGQIAETAAYEDVLKSLKQFVEQEGLGLLGLTHSRIRGNKGTVEFLLWISKSGAVNDNKQIDIKNSVQTALALPSWDGEHVDEK